MIFGQLGCFSFLSRLGEIILWGAVAIIVAICIVIMAKHKGSRKIVCYALGGVVIMLGVFSCLGLKHDLGLKSYVNGSLDIHNEFTTDSFKYSNTSVTFYDGENNAKSYSTDLKKVNNFDGEKYNYEIKLNGYILPNAKVELGKISASCVMEFRSASADILCTGTLYVTVTFLSSKTTLELTTLSAEEAQYFEAYFGQGISLEINKLDEKEA